MFLVLVMLDCSCRYKEDVLLWFVSIPKSLDDLNRYNFVLDIYFRQRLFTLYRCIVSFILSFISYNKYQI